TPVAAVKGRCPRPARRWGQCGIPGVGGARRDRTADLLHAMQALSQLSYSPALNERATLSQGLFPVKKSAIRSGRSKPQIKDLARIPLPWPPGHLAPAVAQGDDAVEHRPIEPGQGLVADEIALALELVALARPGLRQGRLDDAAGEGAQRIR